MPTMALAPLDQDRGAVGDGEGGLHVLLDQQDGDAAAPDLDQLLEDDADELRRKAGRRLVEHQDLRRADQRPRDGASIWRWPPESAPARRPALTGEVGEQRIEIAQPRASRRLSGWRRELEIVVDREVDEDVLGLRHEAEPSCGADGPASGDLAPVQHDRPPATGTSPAIALTRVDLPAPFGPRTATISFGSTAERRAAHDREPRLVAGFERLDRATPSRGAPPR